jgi:hypothetical protein
MANKYWNKRSMPLAIKKMQLKITLRFHLAPVRMTITNNTNTTNVGKDAWKNELFSTVDGI